jgi:hypothetical protein
MKGESVRRVTGTENSVQWGDTPASVPMVHSHRKIDHKVSGDIPGQCVASTKQVWNQSDFSTSSAPQHR